MAGETTGLALYRSVVEDSRTADPPKARAADGSTDEVWSLARRALIGLAVVAGALQVALGVVWWALNLSVVPAYGDSPEYLRLSRDLEVDGYRTIAYPLLVRAGSAVAAWADVPVQVPLYIGQTALVCAAVWYLVRTAAPSLPDRWAAAATAVVVTSPLVLHYANSVLSDSFAASLFVLALAGAARVVVRGDLSLRTAALTSSAALGAALMRTEKAAVLLAVAVLLGLGVLLARRRARRRETPAPSRAALAVAVVALALPAVLGSAVNGATQTGDHGRPEGGLVTAAFSRIVWPHLAEIHGQLPPTARAAITLEDAEAFDVHNNAALPMTQRMRDLDGGGDAVTTAAIRAALDCCALTIARDAGVDAAEYAFTPLTIAVEGMPALLADRPPETATWWNLTRMQAARPALTTALVLVSFVLLGALLAVVTVSAAASRRRSDAARDRGRTTILLLVWLGAVLNGCFFAAAMGADANVRYGLSTTLAVMSALAVTATCAWYRRAAGPAAPAGPRR